MEDPREWYGEDAYIPFEIGIPSEIETLLRFARRQKDNVWSLTCRDTFNIIMHYVARAYAVEGYNIAIGISDPSLYVTPGRIVLVGEQMTKIQQLLDEIRAKNPDLLPMPTEDVVNILKKYVK